MFKPLSLASHRANMLLDVIRRLSPFIFMYHENTQTHTPIGKAGAPKAQGFLFSFKP